MTFKPVQQVPHHVVYSPCVQWETTAEETRLDPRVKVPKCNRHEALSSQTPLLDVVATKDIRFDPGIRAPICTCDFFGSNTATRSYMYHAFYFVGINLQLIVEPCTFLSAQYNIARYTFVTNIYIGLPFLSKLFCYLNFYLSIPVKNMITSLNPDIPLYRKYLILNPVIIINLNFLQSKVVTLLLTMFFWI